MSSIRFIERVSFGLFLFVAVPCFAETAEEHEEEAARLYVRKQYEQALREFRAAHQISSKPRFLFNIGQCYRRMGLGPEAVDYFHRYLAEEKSPDPTIQAELYAYIEQIQAAQDPKSEKSGNADIPEPPPRLVADELVDLEELGEQIVRDEKSGRSAAATELLNQVKQVWVQRHDPIVFYHVARIYERMGKNDQALEYYRRYLGTEPVDSPQRKEAALSLVRLTPAPPGQKLLWPALAFGIVGVAGIATGLGLYFESKKTFELYQQPVAEPDKRALRSQGEPLALGSTIGYAIGGGLLGTAAIFTFVALGKGVRKKPPSLIRVPIPDGTSPAPNALSHDWRMPRPMVAVGFFSQGATLALQGEF